MARHQNASGCRWWFAYVFAFGLWAANQLRSSVAEDKSEELVDYSGLKVETTKSPDACHKFAQQGDMLTVHYNGTFEHNGSLFDSSEKRGHPLSFQLGMGEVIKGWDKGLIGMCIGESRKLVVPPVLAYGTKGSGAIPADMTLVFEIELVDIREGAKPPNVFKDVDVDGNKKLTKDEVSTYFKKEAVRLSLNVSEWDISDMVWEVFEVDDKNKDGFISRREFSGPIRSGDEL